MQGTGLNDCIAAIIAGALLRQDAGLRRESE
jgi:hypothetical protein